MRKLIKAFSRLLAPTSRRFYAALEDPQRVQREIQQRLIAQLTACEYGKHYQVRSIQDWTKLPIVDYEDMQPWIARTHTERNVLTGDRILFYEPTSGSSGPVKQIPYTRSLRSAFNTLFCIWAYDLITKGPSFSSGKLYFSITPSFSKTSPTGTSDDADYLNPWLRWLLKPFLVIAPSAETPEDFKDKLAQTLLLAADLEIISVWSPSFLTAQLDYIQAHRERLDKLLVGQLSEARSHLLLQSQIPWSELWPQLKLISCWDSTTAADGAVGLRDRFPHTFVQGKGLLATEAPMTVPLIDAKGHVPLSNDVFFEFEDSHGQCHTIDQLEPGQIYTVIISQMGGLYRYRIGDRVRVTHYFLQSPCLEFCGRGQDVSDLAGEKLTVQFVSDVLSQLDLSGANFQSLVPVRTPKDHYVLLLDRCERDSFDAVGESPSARLGHQLEE
ncbi:MAG: GH3 auxin-responsive promoter family protein, partial [Cyanobacteria bacterium J06560_2]